MVRLSRAGQSAVVVADIVCKLEEVRRLARRRRLLFQLPLGIAGLLISNVSVITGFAIGRSVVVGFGTAFGPWLLLLCVMPTDLTAVIVSQIACIGLLNVVFVYHLLPFALTTADCERSGRAALSCDAFDVLNGYATAVVGAHLVLAGYNIVTMVHRHRTHARWLPRASLEVSWRILGSFLLCYAPTFIAVGAIELYAPLSELFLLNQNEAQASPSLRATLRFLQAAWFFTLGGLALWPPLRARAQGFLASRNEGVAAAASISELLGPSDPATLLALAKRTFRAVSCDHLQPHHLDTNEPAAEAYALSAVVPLGSIDVFLSHSWHDPPSEKWRLLQVWRKQFVAAHAREPTIWLDRCCIDPSDLDALLPCLPVYLAGCEKMLALAGPTYLSRLWCVVELFVYFEMRADGSRITIVGFEEAEPCAELSPPDGGGVARVEQQPTWQQPTWPWAAAAQRLVAGSASSRAHDARTQPGLTAAAPATLAGASFDVRQAKCTMRHDEDRLLAVIETCGNGFESFNAWMRDLLESKRIVHGAGYLV